jgi:hypothetical protein
MRLFAQHLLRRAAPLVLMLALTGCQSIYYGTMEKFGVPKREIMVDRVESARDAQLEAKDQFKTALERFRSVVRVQGGTLEEKYDKLNAELERSQARADRVHERIAAVEDVSEALFDEWEGELKTYSDADLRRRSEQQLDQTRAQYTRLMTAMKRAESRIEPVLRPMRDQVLFLKHNLNAQAIASIGEELTAVQGDVDALVRDMERSIAEAGAFIDAMGKQ